MYTIDDLLHLLHSDGADRLRLCVGEPPVLVLDGAQEKLDRPVITKDEAEQIFKTIANTRQRRELREQGKVEFICKFRGRASFVVKAWTEGDKVGMEIH